MYVGTLEEFEAEGEKLEKNPDYEPTFSCWEYRDGKFWHPIDAAYIAKKPTGDGVSTVDGEDRIRIGLSSEWKNENLVGNYKRKPEKNRYQKTCEIDENLENNIQDEAWFPPGEEPRAYKAAYLYRLPPGQDANRRWRVSADYTGKQACL